MFELNNTYNFKLLGNFNTGIKAKFALIVLCSIPTNGLVFIHQSGFQDEPHNKSVK